MTLSLYLRLICLALATLCVLGTSGDAYAQSAEEEAANVLYTDGKSAFERGRYGKALNLFQQAYEVIQNDFIRFYLGRTYAALNQCEQALSHFDTLSERLPPAPGEQRRQDEVRCRLHLATGYLDGYRCHEALELLKPIALQVKAPDSRRTFAALQATAKQCTDVFGTRTTVGQRAARFYAEARSALRRGNVPRALKLADKSLASKPSRPAAAVEAIALAKLGRCQVAIPRLEAAMPHANSDDAHLMGELNTKCRLSEGKRLLKGGSCYQIIAMLEPLEGKLKADDDLWRRQKINWCRPHATPFPTDTAPRKAAYTLFRAAREAREGGKDGAAIRAAELYAKALKLADEVVIRRELARVQVPALGCDASAKTMAGLPHDVQTDQDRALVETCTRYGPDPQLKGAELEAHVKGLLEVLALRDAGVHLQAISRLDGLSTKASQSVQGLRADLLYGAGRCEAFIREVEEMEPETRSRVADVEQRVSDCAKPIEEPSVADVSDASSTSVAEAVTPTLVRSASTDGGGLVPWLTLGSGAALGVAGIALTVAWIEGQGRYDEARQRYESGSGDEALAALETMNTLSDEGALTSGLALGLGAAGAVALGVGLYLVLTAAPTSATVEQPSLSIYPWVSPQHVGFSGNF